MLNETIKSRKKSIGLNFSKSCDQLHTGSRAGATACSLRSQAQFYIISHKYDITHAPQLGGSTGG